MPFIPQKSFKMQKRRMRGIPAPLSLAMVTLFIGMSPSAAFGRETEQDAANCNDPKHRHAIARPLTESLPIRKSDKVRVRRILM
jgi:hypothetical protein